MIDFSGRTLALTGAASGIGAAVARLFHSHGANVVLIDRNEDALAALAAELATPDRVLVEALDVIQAGAVETAFQRAQQSFGGIDHLVPAAGIFRPAPLAAMTDAQWHDTLSVNLDAVFRTCRAALPHLRDGGSIVTIASIAGHRGAPNHTHYSASKGAILAFSRALAGEVAPRLRVNAVSPGIITTPMTADMLRDRGDRLLAQSLLGRFGTPEEVAGVIAFLCSDLASFVNGETVHINGGVYMAS
jgi:3-oxoacyl-[acyl-carrier protein] reductase